MTTTRRSRRRGNRTPRHWFFVLLKTIRDVAVPDRHRTTLQIEEGRDD